MKLFIIVGAALFSVGWALSESRPRRHPPLVQFAEPPPAQLAEPSRPREPPSTPPAPTLSRPPQAKQAKQAKQAIAVAKLSGRIVDGNGNPRADAKADLDLGALCIWIYTDGEGRFEATVAPGDYRLHA